MITTNNTITLEQLHALLGYYLQEGYDPNMPMMFGHYLTGLENVKKPTIHVGDEFTKGIGEGKEFCLL